MTPTSAFNSVLFDSDGKPISLAGAVVAPGALSHAAVWQLPGQLHPFRSDESLRTNPEDAKAMRRRAFHARLMQERTAQTVTLKWKPTVPNPDDPEQKAVQDALAEAWDAYPDKVNSHEQLLEMVWFGKSGLQYVWDKNRVVYHEPVHGDSIQFDWAGTPVLLVSQESAKRFERDFPNSVLPPGEVMPEVVKGSDRGAYGLKLNHPALRRRFALSQFRREAADYFDGDMSGRIHGTGLRDRVFWTDQMLVTAEAGMLNFLFSTGMMDLLLFNYLSSNEESRKAAQSNASKITGKLALLVPCGKDEYARRGPVEQIPMNAAGVEALKGVITDLYMVQEEHLFVGQSMSTGMGGGGGLEGSGKAEFAESTKTALQRTDAERLATTYTRDWAIPQRDFLFPGSTVPVQMVPLFENKAEQSAKFDRGLQLVTAGVAVEVEELREAAGFREPRPGKPTIGGAVAALPGTTPPAGGAPAAPNPVLPPGEPTAATQPNPVLPPGQPVSKADELPAAPNPVLPPGRAADPAASVPGDQVSDEEAADALAGLVESLNAALGTPGAGDRDAILAAVQSGRATDAAVPYRAMQSPFPGGVFDEGKRRWTVPGRPTAPQTAAAAPPGPDPAAAGQTPAPGVGAAGGGTLADLGAEFAAELADPKTADAANGFFKRATDAVTQWAVSVSPHILPVLEALLDTPEDMMKFGFAPSGTPGGGGDPLKAATGIGSHMAAAIVSKVLAAVWVKGKRVVGYAADGELVLYVDGKPAKFGCTLVKLTGEAEGRLLALGAAIPPDELADDGRETEPHVTVKYGLHNDDPAEVYAAVKGFGPVMVTLTKLSAFRASETGKDYDVLFCEVDSPGLHRLNAVVADACEHTDTWPTYKPHATIAYLKPGAADKYVRESAPIDLTTTVDRIEFSDTARRKTTIVLVGPQSFGS